MTRTAPIKSIGPYGPVSIFQVGPGRQCDVRVTTWDGSTPHVQVVEHDDYRFADVTKIGGVHPLLDEAIRLQTYGVAGGWDDLAYRSLCDHLKLDPDTGRAN